ncbi:hypothetical protein AVEN_31554-1 [Araneus ventricosus]|uniref:Transposase Tc1-like domain-containing protein n=1 Tax=Araneus ventricosus TaxID=182803 RepID=A0A4Y2PQM2_ARAVE|nr:hypothetical protein AVEN_31554-1 [Araneus ventricosus]
MLQFASSDSSAESEIAKAESMSRRNHLHNEMRWRAFGMLQAGARQSAVARELNVHRSVIHRLWNHYQRDQNVSRRRGSGRRGITTTADDRYLLPSARHRRTLTARQLASQLFAAAGRPISRQTVSCRRHAGRLFAPRPVVCVLFVPSARQSWTPEQWGHGLFTDESRFNIQNDSRRAMIWREPGTHSRAPKIVERDRYRGGGLLVWEGIATNGRTDLSTCSLGIPSQLSDIATKSYTLLCGLLSLQWVPARCFWTITPARIEDDWCGVIWRVKPFHRWRGLLDRRIWIP